MTARRACMVLAACAALLVVGVSCQNPARNEDRISKLESSVANVSSIATRVNTLEGKEQGLDGQVAALNESLAAAQGSLEEIRKEVAGAQGADAALKKKVDGMAAQVNQAAAAAGRIASVEQKITLLETRYNDHLRKYHGG
jgi:predicted  nucleic acid-binding Zn-ribbon protein